MSGPVRSIGQRSIDLNRSADWFNIHAWCRYFVKLVSSEIVDLCLMDRMNYAKQLQNWWIHRHLVISLEILVR